MRVVNREATKGLVRSLSYDAAAFASAEEFLRSDRLNDTAGRDYLTVVRDAFDRIAIGTERLLERQASGVLIVSTSPDFAAKWLIHRIGGFAESHPEIDLRISATLHHVDFAREDVDVAVRHGDGHWAGLDVVRLTEEQLFPVCSPAHHNSMGTPADVLKLPLLHLDDRKD